MFFINLKIGQRLAATFGIIVFLLISITGLGVFRLATLNECDQAIISASHLSPRNSNEC